MSINLLITPELFDFIDSECDSFQESNGEHVDVGDVLYSYLNPGLVLNDWDEGCNNDPNWNYELNKHSAIVFIEKMCVEIKAKCSLSQPQ